MINWKKKMVRVQLDSGVDEFRLFCPYCGREVLSKEQKQEHCLHLIYYGMDDPEDEIGEKDFRDNDLCFVYFDEKEQERWHFVFREPQA